MRHTTGHFWNETFQVLKTWKVWMTGKQKCPVVWACVCKNTKRGVERMVQLFLSVYLLPAAFVVFPTFVD
jgi:hypothetical protein